MKKLFSFMLMATALLISGNAWAEGDMNGEPLNAKAKIGEDQYYSSVALAIADVPANGIAKTVTMVNDEDAGTFTSAHYCTIAAGQVVTLDLNGHTLQMKADGSSAVSTFHNYGTLTIMDSQDSEKNGGAGKIFMEILATASKNAVQAIVLNEGSLFIESGMFDQIRNIYMNGSYVIEQVSSSYDAYCTVSGGKLAGDYCIFRQYTGSQTHQNVVTVTGGIFVSHAHWFSSGAEYRPEKQYSIFNLTDNSNDNLTLVISGGTFDNFGNAMIYMSSDNNMSLRNASINISGGVTNGNMVTIDRDVDQTGHENPTAIQALYNQYANIFNITGGTCSGNVYTVSNCNTVYNEEKGCFITTPISSDEYVLPTLIDGDYWRPYPTGNPNDLEEVIITHVDRNENVTSGSDINNENAAFVIGKEGKQEITIQTGTNAEAYNLSVKNGSIVTVANGAVLTVGDGGITVEAGSKIIVEAGGILKVGAYGFEGTGADALIVYSNPTASGIVALSPMAYLHNTPALKIIMNSNAYTNPDNADDYYWQFFAIPTSGNCHFQWASGAAPYMKKFDVGTQAWVSITNPNDLNTPFVGYAMTNDCPARGDGQYTMTGNLVGRENAVMKLTVQTAGAETGWNLFGNSYLAPIDVNELIADIRVGDEVIAKAVYAYNSYNGQYVFSNKTVKGKIVFPDESTKDFTSIAPMSAFFLENKGNGEAGFTINYAKTVYGKENIEPMMAPARSNDAKVLNIHVQAGKYADDLYFVQNGDEDDNVTKLMNDNMNIYAVAGDKKQISVNADNMSNMPIAFQAGNDVTYTMTFSNDLNGNFVLVDNENGAQVAMTEGATYTFVATPNSTDANRFEIRKITSVVTGNEDAVVDGRKDGTYLVKDRLVIVKNGKAFNVLGL